MAGSFALLFLLDQLNSTVKDVDFVKGFGAPVLAIIPRLQDPALEVRRRRRSRRILGLSGLYFLVMLCFPAMELLGLPYMDRVLDALSGTEVTQSIKGLVR